MNTFVCAMWSPFDSTGMRVWCMNAHLSIEADTQLHLCSSLSVVFKKNKCGKTSAEMWFHTAGAHYKWFLPAGWYTLAPFTSCFSPTDGFFSAFYQSLSFEWDRQTVPCFSPASYKNNEKTKCQHGHLNVLICLPASFLNVQDRVFNQMIWGSFKRN